MAGPGADAGGRVATLDDAASHLHRLLEGTPDEWLGRQVEMLDGRPVEGWRVLLLMVEHEVHHRSQVQTYAGLFGWGAQHVFGRSAEEAGLQLSG